MLILELPYLISEEQGRVAEVSLARGELEPEVTRCFLPCKVFHWVSKPHGFPKMFVYHRMGQKRVWAR